MTTEITEDTFDQIIDGNTNVLVDCWAPWCGPCRRLGPIIDEIASEYGSQVKVVKLNVDECKELAAKLEVGTLPTLILYKNGSVEKRLTGVQSRAKLVELLTNA